MKGFSQDNISKDTIYHFFRLLGWLVVILMLERFSLFLFLGAILMNAFVLFMIQKVITKFLQEMQVYILSAQLQDLNDSNYDFNQYNSLGFVFNKVSDMNTLVDSL